MSVRFGVFVPQGWWRDLAEIPDPVAQCEAMTDVARVADQEGYDSLWVFDHLQTVDGVKATTFEPGRSPRPWFEIPVECVSASW